MLKLLEGSEVLVPPQGGRKHPEQKMVKVDTTNILFICGGAFDGIERIISNRLKTGVIGFNKGIKGNEIDEANMLQYINPSDLRQFGLIPELIGRLPVLSHLNPLDKKTLRAILTEPKNSLIKQYKKLMKMEGVKLEFPEDTLEYIVEKSIEYKLGARGLRSICEAIMTDIMYELPSMSDVKAFEVTKDIAAEKLNKSKIHMLKAA
jgi:ATP-dependent Clp protease ATP-binding subunit ClpX